MPRVSAAVSYLTYQANFQMGKLPYTQPVLFFRTNTTCLSKWLCYDLAACQPVETALDFC